MAGHESSSEFYYQRGLGKQDTNDIKGSIADFNEAIKLDSRKAEYYFMRGKSRCKLDEIDAATLDFSEAIRLNPNYAFAYNNRGVTNKCLGKMETALKDFDRAISIDPNYTQALYNRGLAKKDLGRLKEAIIDFDRTIKLNSQYVLGYLLRGECKKDIGDFNGALTDFEQVIHLNSDSAIGYFNHGMLLEKLGSSSQAINDFDHAIEIEKKSEYYYQRGVAKQNTNELKSSIADFSEAIKLDSRKAEYYFMRGKSKFALGNIDEAILDYTQAINLNSNYAMAYNNRGVAKQYSGNVQAALLDFDCAIYIDSNCSQALYNSGIAKKDIGRVREAIIDFNHAKQSKPDYVDAYLLLGSIKKDLGNLNEALSDFDKAININPYYAFTFFDKAINDPDHTDFYTGQQMRDASFAYLLRGDANVQLCELGSAVDDYNEALKINKDSTLAYKNREKASKSLYQESLTSLRNNDFKLRELNLKHRLFGDFSINELKTVLVENHTLLKLDLSNNSLGLNTYEDLNETLKNNYTLTEVDLSGNYNDTPPNATKNISKALIVNYTLKDLKLGTNVSEPVMANIKFCLRRNQTLAPFFEAVYQGDEETVNILITKRFLGNETKGALYWALKMASHQGNVSMVKYLIDQNAPLDSIYDVKSPLLIACEKGHYTIASYLLEKGAKTKDEADKTILNYKVPTVHLVNDDNDYFEEYITGNVESNSNKLTEAIVHYDRAIKLNVDNINAYKGRAYAKFRLNDFKGAIEDFDRIIARNVKDLDVICYRGHSNLCLKNYQEAISDYDNLLKTAPNYGKRIYFYRGLAKKHIDLKASIKDFDEAIKQNADDFECYYLRGNVKLNIHDLLGAEKDYDQAISINSQFIPAMVTKTHIEERLKHLTSNPKWDIYLNDNEVDSYLQKYAQNYSTKNTDITNLIDWSNWRTFKNYLNLIDPFGELIHNKFTLKILLKSMPALIENDKGSNGLSALDLVRKFYKNFINTWFDDQINHLLNDKDAVYKLINAGTGLNIAKMTEEDTISELKKYFKNILWSYCENLACQTLKLNKNNDGSVLTDEETMNPALFEPCNKAELYLKTPIHFYIMQMIRACCPLKLYDNGFRFLNNYITEFFIDSSNTTRNKIINRNKHEIIARTTESLISNNKFDYDIWIVTLVRDTLSKNNPEHAFIIVEGMNGYGRIILHRYDLSLINKYGYDVQKKFAEVIIRPKVNIEKKSYEDELRSLICKNDQNPRRGSMSLEGISWNIRREDAKLLHKLIQSEEDKLIPFYSWGDKALGSGNGHNCFTWAREKLAGLNNKSINEKLSTKTGHFFWRMLPERVCVIPSNYLNKPPEYDVVSRTKKACSNYCK